MQGLRNGAKGRDSAEGALLTPLPPPHLKTRPPRPPPAPPGRAAYYMSPSLHPPKVAGLSKNAQAHWGRFRTARAQRQLLR